MFLWYIFFIVTGSIRFFAIATTLTAFTLAAQPNGATNYKENGTAQSQPAVHAPDSVDKQASGKTNDAKASENPPLSNAGMTPWYEKPEWWTLIVTAFAAGIVGWQSWETRKAAQATLLNAQVLINIERAWLVVNQEAQEANEGEDGWVYWFDINAFNRGKNPAQIVYYTKPAFSIFSADEKMLSQPPYGERVIEATRPTFVMAGSESYGLLLNVSENDFIEADKKRNLFPLIASRKATAYVYGVIAYRDLIGDRNSAPYETRWCYRYYRDGKGVVGYLITEGPEGYIGFT